MKKYFSTALCAGLLHSVGFDGRIQSLKLDCLN